RGRAPAGHDGGGARDPEGRRRLRAARPGLSARAAGLHAEGQRRAGGPHPEAPRGDVPRCRRARPGRGRARGTAVRGAEGGAGLLPQHPGLDQPAQGSPDQGRPPRRPHGPDEPAPAGAAGGWNLYGPTECTIDATAHRCRPEEVGAHGATEPIGRPIRRMEALVLDARLRPVPDGAPGELYLAGPCLARGYLNRPELTASRFIEHAFPDGPRLRMYKTGDVVRRRPDGTLLFGGRADRQ